MSVPPIRPTRPAVKAPVQHTALSPGQTDVLRKLVKDRSFRSTFFNNPAEAVSKAGLTVSSNDISVLAQLKPAQIDAVQSVIGSMGRVAADGTNTALYALAYAVVVALLLAMPNPMDVAALEGQRAEGG